MLGETVTAASTIVSPNRTTAEPAACFASRPVSSMSGRPANWVSILCAVTAFSLSVFSGFFAARTLQCREGVPMRWIGTPPRVRGA